MFRIPTKFHHSFFNLSRNVRNARAIAFVLVASGLASQTLNAQPCDAWKQTVIGPRSQHEMVYDSARGEVVLFGGLDQPSSVVLPHGSGETWAWNGQRWNLRATAGPLPRIAHAMAYDEARHVVVLFGGLKAIHGQAELGDTWEWDGQSWTLRNTSGPPPRHGHAMAYDSARRVMVMFGGNGPFEKSGTWEWNGSQWSHRTDSGPFDRNDHTMVYNSSRHVTVLYGGYGNSAHLNDMWEWDGYVWTVMPSAGPPPSRGHSMVYDSANDRIVLFGGRFRIIDDRDTPWPFLAQTWVWNNFGWTQLDIEGPPAIVHAGMAFDSSRGVTVMFGGGEYYWIEGETWELRDNTWSQRAQSGPYPGVGDAVYDSDRQVIAAFDFWHDSFDRLWEYSNSSWSLRFAPNAPPVRSQYELAYDVSRQVIVMFGGHKQGVTNETWEWNGRRWNDRTSPGPSPRDDHAMCYDIARGKVIVMGGNTNTSEGMGDMWIWDGKTWSQYNGLVPPPRYSHDMSYDSLRSVAVLYGGRHFATVYQDTWEWNGEAWSLRSENGPLGVWDDITMAFDEGRAVTTLLSDRAEINVDNSEIWEWDGFSWKLQTPMGPTQRYDAAMAYDAARGVMTVFGGSSSGQLGDTWEFQSSIKITQHPVNQTVLTGSAAQFTVNAIAPDPLSYQWYKGDVALTEGGPFTGVHSPTLTINPVTLALEGDYHAAVIDECGLASVAAVLTAEIDLTNDGRINVDDLLALILAWGPCTGVCLADLNLDGSVNGVDLQLLLSIWG